MLLTALYHMLKNGENYNAEIYRKSDLPPVDREITVEHAIILSEIKVIKSSQKLHNLNFSIFNF